jgi:Ca-activated chloride channel family protein
MADTKILSDLPGDSPSFSFRLSSLVVQEGDGPRLLYGLVEINGGQGAEALPSNLGFLIDISESMRIRLVTEKQFAELVKNGLAKEVMTDGVPAYQITAAPNEWMAQLPRRIDYVADALKIAAEMLRENDYFSLVAFASQAQVLSQQSSGKERARLRQAARELETLKLGDETHMADGLAMAFAETQRSPGKDLSSRLIVLTDGHTRKVNECYEWAKQAQKAGIKLTTLGIGNEFNEDLLIPLADLTGGNAYFIESPDKLCPAFEQELGFALRIRYRNMEVKLQLMEGVKLRRVYRVLPELGDFDQGLEIENSYSLFMGDYDPDVPVALLLELVLQPGLPGSYRLAQTMLAWDDPESESHRQRIRKDVMIERSDSMPARLDEHVMNMVEKVGAYKMGNTALEAAQNAAQGKDPKDKGAATVRLRQAATRLLDLGEANLASAMFNQADLLESSGSLDPEAAKKLRYETRRLTQR